MSGELRIRVAGRHDRELRALYRQLAEADYAFDTPRRPLLRPLAERTCELCAHLDELESEERVWFVVPGLRQLIGSVCVREVVPSLLAVPVMEIRDVVVDKNHRGRGVGRALLNYAFAWGIERGMRGAMVEVAEANTPARRLYEAYGMYATGRTLVRDLGGGRPPTLLGT